MNVCEGCHKPIEGKKDLSQRRGYNGKWYHFACFQPVIRAEVEKQEQLSAERKNEPKAGFTLKYATCRNCKFRLRSDHHIEHSVAPQKDEIFAEVVALHDSPSRRRKCEKRSLIVVYLDCLYEQE